MRQRRAGLLGLALGAMLVPSGCLDEPEQFRMRLRFDDGTEPDGSCEVSPTLVDPVIFVASGKEVVTLIAEVPCETSSTKQLTFTTSLGALTPTGADAGAQAMATRTTLGTRDTQVLLNVGTIAGLGTVRVEGRGLSATADFQVVPLEPALTITGPQGALVADGFNSYEFEFTYSAKVAGAALEDPEPLTDPIEATVRVTLGALSPHLEGPATFERKVLLIPGMPSTVTLFAGAGAGPGEFVVRVGEAVEASEPYVLVQPADSIVIIAPDPPLIADAGSAYSFEIQLSSETTEPVQLALDSTGGVLNPNAADGAARYESTLTVLAGVPQSVLIYAPGKPGVGTLLASLATGAKTQASFTFVQPSDVLELSVDPGTYFADEQNVVPVEISLSSALSGARVVKVSASSGVFAGGQTAGDERSVELEPGQSATLSLLAGREAGTLLLTADIDGDALTQTSLVLEYSPPTLLALSTNAAVLRQGVLAIAATASFGRGVGQGRVSLATQVDFMACCDPQGDGSVEACTQFVSVSSFAQAPPTGEDQVVVPLTLTPQGVTFVESTGAPPSDDLNVSLHAYVIDPSQAPFALTCAALEDVPALPGAVLVVDTAMLALRRLPAPG